MQFGGIQTFLTIFRTQMNQNHASLFRTCHGDRGSGHRDGPSADLLRGESPVVTMGYSNGPRLGWFGSNPMMEETWGNLHLQLGTSVQLKPSMQMRRLPHIFSPTGSKVFAGSEEVIQVLIFVAFWFRIYMILETYRVLLEVTWIHIFSEWCLGLWKLLEANFRCKWLNSKYKLSQPVIFDRTHIQ